MVVAPAVVISPTTVGTPVVPMIRVVMRPGGVMAGKVPIVDAAVMREGPTVAVPHDGLPARPFDAQCITCPPPWCPCPP